jgi:hypothetical protein
MRELARNVEDVAVTIQIYANGKQRFQAEWTRAAHGDFRGWIFEGLAVVGLNPAMTR